MKTSVNYLYFFEEAIAELEENILTVSEERIDRLIDQIHAYAEINELEIFLLEQLLARIKEKKGYYYSRKHESYDSSALKSAFLFVMILLMLAVLFYCFEKYYDLPKRREMWALIEELKPYGITIKECSKRFYRHTEYWLEMSATKEYLPADQYNTVKSMVHQIYEIHATLRGTFRWIFIIIGSIAFYIITVIWSYIKQWLRPRYKERYEKFSWLGTKIQQRIACIQKN